MAIKYHLRVVGWKAVPRLPMPACPSQETANGCPFTGLEQVEQYEREKTDMVQEVMGRR